MVESASPPIESSVCCSALGSVMAHSLAKPIASRSRPWASISRNCPQRVCPRRTFASQRLGPRCWILSRDRTAGAHPYLVTPEHSAMARKALGPDALLAPEQGVVLETDPGRARELARKAMRTLSPPSELCE